MTRNAWAKANACRSLPCPIGADDSRTVSRISNLPKPPSIRVTRNAPERNRLDVDPVGLRPESPGNGHAEQERNRPEKTDRDPLRAKQAFQHAARLRFATCTFKACKALPMAGKKTSSAAIRAATPRCLTHWHTSTAKSRATEYPLIHRSPAAVSPHPPAAVSHRWPAPRPN